MNKIQPLSFPVNNWEHLYSLQKAISHNDQLTGRKLSLSGQISNQPFLQNQATQIDINFIQVDQPPDYPLTGSDTHELGTITLTEQQLSTSIKIDRKVFEELRMNLMEYADIDGIHIMVTLGLLSNEKHWHNGKTLQIIQLDYAMKGNS